MSRAAWRRVVPSLGRWWWWSVVRTPEGLVWVPRPVLRRLGRDVALALARAVERETARRR
jgi:hypothetical protein